MPTSRTVYCAANPFEIAVGDMYVIKKIHTRNTTLVYTFKVSKLYLRCNKHIHWIFWVTEMWAFLKCNSSRMCYIHWSHTCKMNCYLMGLWWLPWEWCKKCIGNQRSKLSTQSPSRKWFIIHMFFFSKYWSNFFTLFCRHFGVILLCYMRWCHNPSTHNHWVTVLWYQR